MPEHVLRLSKFWQLNTRETQYFFNLVNKARAGTKELRDFHHRALLSIKEDSETLAKRYEQKDISSEHQSIYYSDWLLSAVHILVTVPTFQTARAISERLSIPTKSILRVLKQLQKLGLIELKNTRWISTKKVQHLSKESTFNSLNHQNWRQRAVLDSALENEESTHYTAVYSLSFNDYQRLRELLLDFMDKTREIVGPSKEEEVVCFNCDLFRV